VLWVTKSHFLDLAGTIAVLTKGPGERVDHRRDLSCRPHASHARGAPTDTTAMAPMIHSPIEERSNLSIFDR